MNDEQIDLLIKVIDQQNKNIRGLMDRINRLEKLTMIGTPPSSN